jgi:hypothetical protein
LKSKEEDIDHQTAVDGNIQLADTKDEILKMQKKLKTLGTGMAISNSVCYLSPQSQV